MNAKHAYRHKHDRGLFYRVKVDHRLLCFCLATTEVKGVKDKYAISEQEMCEGEPGETKCCR